MKRSNSSIIFKLIKSNIVNIIIVVFAFYLIFYSINKDNFSQKVTLSSILYSPNFSPSLEKRIEILERDVRDIKRRIRENEDIIKKKGYGYQR